MAHAQRFSSALRLSSTTLAALLIFGLGAGALAQQPAPFPSAP